MAHRPTATARWYDFRHVGSFHTVSVAVGVRSLDGRTRNLDRPWQAPESITRYRLVDDFMHFVMAMIHRITKLHQYPLRSHVCPTLVSVKVFILLS